MIDPSRKVVLWSGSADDKDHNYLDFHHWWREHKNLGATLPLLMLRQEAGIPTPECSFQTAIQHLRARLQQQMGALLSPLIAVGISVARYPPHKSVRAL